MSPSWQKWMYCMGLMSADINTWQSVLDEYTRTQNAVFLEYLACSDDESIIIQYLQTLTSIDERLESKHLQRIYISILKNHAKKDKVLKELILHFMKSNPR